MIVFALALALALIHVFAGRLRFLGALPRSRWLSFASGLSVAYVFVHLLPELAEGQEHLSEIDLGGFTSTDSHVWIVALLGLATFYGLEHLAKRSRERQRDEEGEDRTEHEVFWIHIGSYGLYNLLIGYVLHERASEGTAMLLLFWLAMALHFFVNDYGLRGHHREMYEHRGRWLLALAVGAGSILGAIYQVSPVTLALFLAFLGGSVVLNVLKEELPQERESRFWPFAMGAAAYTALLMAM